MKKQKVNKTCAIPVEKLAAAQTAVEELDKRFGERTIARLGSSKGVSIPCIPTGIYSLDKYVIQAGGFPKGRIVEIFGTESGGKTTLALTVIASCQVNGGVCAFVDAEHALDTAWAEKQGVNTDDLYLCQPDNGEQALEVVEHLIRSGAFDLVVVDSVAALTPLAEINGDMGDSHMGLQARMMSQALRKLVGAISKSNTCLVFINQVRDKIGVMFGSPETTTGGRALKFYASLRLDVRRIGQIKDGDVITGGKIKIKASKNKIGSPFRETELDLKYDIGIDAASDLLEYAAMHGIVTKSGSWYSYGETRLGQGKDGAIKSIDADMFKEISNKLYNLGNE